MNLRSGILFVALLILPPGAAYAQVPGVIPWWDGPIVRDLGLSEDQQRQIRAAVRESRTRLIQLRASVEAAEAELQDEMNEEKIDQKKADAAIEKVVASRGELTRAISQMSLRLRTVLSSEQWHELQRRQPRPGVNPPAPPHAPNPPGRNPGFQPDRGGPPPNPRPEPIGEGFPVLPPD